MQLQKLNGDSSWLWEIQGQHILVDPWLEGPQIDVAPWFNRQYHKAPCISHEELAQIDLILISHPFTDHCHKATLLKLDASIPLLAPKTAYKKIKSWNHFQQIHLLSDTFQFHGLEFKLLASNKLLDPVHNSLLISREEEGLIFYAPHGATMSKVELNKLKEFDILITTSSTYNLPFFLGGTINLGLKEALQLAKKLNSKHFFLTHDEKKDAYGLVGKLATVNYPDLDKIRATMQSCEVYDLEAGNSISL